MKDRRSHFRDFAQEKESSQVFHSVPHVNITFHPVDPRFNPKNELYLESLGIIASVPAAWLITTLVVLLIYLCTRCCDTKVNL